MASNSFGTLFRITTWGESHGKAIGVVVDGCPAGITLTNDDINAELIRRAPGTTPYTSPRKETDCAEILSGVFQGVTTGAPISIIIPNTNKDSSKYESIHTLLRPGHANFTYLQKYGEFDYRGGGRASARETACRVAAGAIAKKIVNSHGMDIFAHLSQAGSVSAIPLQDLETSKRYARQSPVFAADPHTEQAICAAIEKALAQKDSIGGTVSFIVQNIPVGLGDPVYEKLHANLAKAMLSIPACKGFAVGDGFLAATQTGSEHNDTFVLNNGRITTRTNHAGGVLGGISTGLPFIGDVAFKPTSSIMLPQQTVDINGMEADFMIPEGSRHDPCVAVRAVPVVEAMCALVLADALLMAKAINTKEPA